MISGKPRAKRKKASGTTRKNKRNKKENRAVLFMKMDSCHSAARRPQPLRRFYLRSCQKDGKPVVGIGACLSCKMRYTIVERLYKTDGSFEMKYNALYHS